MSESDKTKLSAVPAIGADTSHKPTEKYRRFVRMAVRAKTTHKEIAEALQISKPTLYKYYKPELKKGKIDLPRVAASKVYAFLNKDFEEIDMQEKQARLGVKVLRSHGWKPSLEGDTDNSLPQLVINVKKPSEG